MTNTIGNQAKLEIIEDEAVDIVVECNVCKGVVTVSRETLYAKAVILTAGTFLNGLIHIGNNKIPAGRIDEKPSRGLTESLVKLGIESGRLKTGTPPRLNGATIDFSKCIPQDGDQPPPFFSNRSNRGDLTQIQCHLTYSNEKTHAILLENLNKSALFSGAINGIGPRYCPSIEDKIVRFRDRNRHQLFLEPEGLDTTEYYLNGFSSSMPEDVQLRAARTIRGLEKVEFNKPAYAIEYDFFPPHQLRPTLESKIIKNLYFAGQVNGTSGYEEAAAQGLMASINVVNENRREKPVVLNRSQAYIGVLIDDLVTKSTDEPYRMFTSRAEYRLFLREDNAEDRLSDIGYSVGLISGKVRENIYNERTVRKKLYKDFHKIRIELPGIEKSLTVAEAARRSDVDFTDIFRRIEGSTNEKFQIVEKTLIEIKYEGYLKRQERHLNRFRGMESVTIPDNFNYADITGLKHEALEKLKRIRPSTLGQASRISGVSPGDIAVFMVYLKNR